MVKLASIQRKVCFYRDVRHWFVKKHTKKSNKPLLLARFLNWSPTATGSAMWFWGQAARALCHQCRPPTQNCLEEEPGDPGVRCHAATMYIYIYTYLYIYLSTYLIIYVYIYIYIFYISIYKFYKMYEYELICTCGFCRVRSQGNALADASWAAEGHCGSVAAPFTTWGDLFLHGIHPSSTESKLSITATNQMIYQVLPCSIKCYQMTGPRYLKVRTILLSGSVKVWHAINLNDKFENWEI